ncbi:two-component system histidine kinase PnpS [Bacillus sp. DJP31]|uniref:two-component system histidine kinase PnpS n=1 Tax=Bacillus sp. DJP31 TaxID=3409789 RepID=UPI003BB4C65F
MNKFRSRLIFGLITLILIVMLGLGIILGQLFKSFYTGTFNQRLEKEANLVALLIEEKGITDTTLQAQIRKIGDALSSRVTVMGANGEIILDSDKPPGFVSRDTLEKYEGILKDRSEENKPFHVIDEKKDQFYYVVPLEETDFLVEGYLLLSLSVDSLKKINQQIWGLLISSLGLAFIVILLLGTRITRHYIKPIEAATIVATELAKGNYKARTYEEHLDETGMLSQSINILARNLQDMAKAQEMQQDRLTTLIESMGSGLILIDGRGYINLINRTYKEIFNVDPIDYLYRLYYEAILHKEIISLVEEIFMTEVKVRKQMLLSFEIERKHFEVYGAPIIGTNDEWKGIVLVFHDISEIKKLEQMRKDFVANVSHELKTPITSIKGFSETLLDGAMKDEKLTENFLTIILKESDRLQSLIQDLLDLSKMEQQGFSINWQKVDLKEVLEEIIVMLKGKAEDKQISLELHVKERTIIDGDLYRLKQIFINLINNAIAYTPSNGVVIVSLENHQNQTHVKVADNGIGITEDELPRIFERFYRVDKARTRNSGGTGLGLAIVKHLVEAHHGRVAVRSKQGKGTTFTVKFQKNLIK